MTHEELRERVTIIPDVSGGQSCIRGTRIPVAVVLDALAEGLSPQDIIDHYPSLTVADVRAAAAYGSS